MRIGQGYDVHRFTPGRNLVLGGVTIPHHQGLAGHSDADVLVHALMDALLGALALGDIGGHFPDTEEAYRGICSLRLLRRVAGILDGAGYVLENMDATIVAQAPKLAPYIPQMRDNLAAALETSPDRINIKATTEEGLGFTGQELGIAAYAVVLIRQKLAR